MHHDASGCVRMRMKVDRKYQNASDLVRTCHLFLISWYFTSISFSVTTAQCTFFCRESGFFVGMPQKVDRKREKASDIVRTCQNLSSLFNSMIFHIDFLFRNHNTVHFFWRESVFLHFWQHNKVPQMHQDASECVGMRQKASESVKKGQNLSKLNNFNPFDNDFEIFFERNQLPMESTNNMH